MFQSSVSQPRNDKGSCDRDTNLVFYYQKPYSAVTVQIEVLTSEQYEVEDSSGIVDLIDVVRIQASGPTEASRALRKKL